MPARALCLLAVLWVGCAHHRTPPLRPGHCGEVLTEDGSIDPDPDYWFCPLCEGQAPKDAAMAAQCFDTAALERFIVEGKQDINARDRFGKTLLGRTMTSFDVYWHPYNPRMTRTVRWLLAHGADPNLRLPNGTPPLHIAAYDGNMNLVAPLVEAGADVNARLENGMTPLHTAAVCDFRLSCDDCGPKKGAKATIEYLLAHGADPLARDNTGKTAFERMATPCDRDPKACQDPLPKQWPTGTCLETWKLLRGHERAKN